MQKKLFRILSVFLAVVIISVGFMQPIAYANPVAVGGGALVLLVAGLLITCGMVFADQAQAEAVANYVLSAMPSDLREELDNVIHVQFPDNWGGGGGDSGGDKDPKFPKFKSFITGFASSVAIGSTLYIRFKSWFDATFGVDEEVWNGGDGSVPMPEMENGFTGRYASIVVDGVECDIPVYNISPFENQNSKFALKSGFENIFSPLQVDSIMTYNKSYMSEKDIYSFDYSSGSNNYFLVYKNGLQLAYTLWFGKTTSYYAIYEQDGSNGKVNRCLIITPISFFEANASICSRLRSFIFI